MSRDSTVIINNENKSNNSAFKRNKQIEEMAFDLCLMERCKHLPQAECNNTTCANCEAEALYNAGYRKASEVAEEIFGEIEATSSYSVDECNGRQIYSTKIYTISALKLAELKKKYTKGGDINVPTKESEDKNDS